MSLIEIQGSRAYSMDAAKNRRATRMWYSSQTSDQAAIKDFNDEAGSKVYPGDATLVFDRVDASPNQGGSGFTLTATYTTNKSARFSTVPVKTGGHVRARWSSVGVTTKIPINVRGTIVVPDGDTTRRIDVWEQKEVSVAEEFEQFVVTIRIEPRVPVSEMRSIAKEVNNIHKIGDYLLRFVRGTETETDGTYTEVTYVWELDPGSPFPDLMQIGPNALVLSPANRQRDDDLLRLPYETLRSVGSQDPETTPHDTIAVRTYVNKPDGYTRLPGGGLL